MHDKTRVAENGEMSLHDRIVTEIRNHILSGIWKPGYRVPSEMELAEQYGCSRMTINKALTQLARAGYVERRRRAGTFVRRPQVATAILEIPDIQSEITALGMDYRYDLLTHGMERAGTSDATRQGLKQNESVLNMTCLHYADNTPFCLEERLINLTAVPDARSTDFSSTPPGTWLLRQVPWQEAEHVITAISVGEIVASMLEIPEETPCLSVERRTWNSSHIVTWVRITYPAANHSLVARFTPS